MDGAAANVVKAPEAEKAIAEGISHRGFSFIEVLSQCPVQAGKNVYGEKEPSKIMDGYKKGTYVYKGEKEQLAGSSLPDLKDGKIPIGLLHYDPEASEYLERVEAKLKAEGVR